MTTPYHIKIAPAARRQFLMLTIKQQKFILKLAAALAVNPRPPGSKKVEGMTGLYCETIDNIRLIYKIEEQEVLLLLLK